uniref:D-isomer specific 2-hydroxyacid dehydrogenase NAD-binding domain-containing protein n=1 Tax=Ciona intestinalis TaxID=7719 RepID=H2XSL4_CIOIN|nr:uncharacterized protein LOC100178832 [Ciona intestinalis]|eukprot:XP_002130283.1 uncharacterized protein LOC100178832 [Ciona intestinalis]
METRRIVVGLLNSVKIFNAELLENKLDNVQYKVIATTGQTHEQMIASVDGCEVLFGSPRFIQPIIPQLPTSVKWVQFTYAGLDGFFESYKETPNAPAWDIQYTRMGDVFALPISEYVLGAVIAIERDFKEMFKLQSAKQWADFDDYVMYMTKPRPLNSLTAGILGAGNIGTKIAELLKAVGMRVIGFKNHQVDRDDGLFDEFYYPDNLDMFLSSCDFICNILPSTPNTIGLLSGKRLEICEPRKPAFINVGRGNIIDEKSLIQALTNGWISKAFLDVLHEEPLLPSSKLWEMDNVVITPHVSGPFVKGQLTLMFKENLKLYIQELKFQVYPSSNSY